MPKLNIDTAEPDALVRLYGRLQAKSDPAHGERYHAQAKLRQLNQQHGVFWYNKPEIMSKLREEVRTLQAEAAPAG